MFTSFSGCISASVGLGSLGWGRAVCVTAKGQEGSADESSWQEDSECFLRKQEGSQRDGVGWSTPAALCKAAGKISNMNSKDDS